MFAGEGSRRLIAVILQVLPEDLKIKVKQGDFSTSLERHSDIRFLKDSWMLVSYLFGNVCSFDYEGLSFMVNEHRKSEWKSQPSNYFTP